MHCLVSGLTITHKANRDQKRTKVKRFRKHIKTRSNGENDEKLYQYERLIKTTFKCE